jgi:ATP-binding cassette subfamily D (ALD) long-chain fatty acid import protein
MNRYYWGALGFLICALPVFSPFGKVAASTSLTSRTKDFVTNRRLLLNTSDAFGSKDIQFLFL